MPVEHSPLRMAPHTMEDLIRDWDRPYTRETGLLPARGLPRRQVLATGQPGRQRPRRPAPDLHLPADGKLPRTRRNSGWRRLRWTLVRRSRRISPSHPFRPVAAPCGAARVPEPDRSRPARPGRISGYARSARKARRAYRPHSLVHAPREEARDPRGRQPARRPVACHRCARRHARADHRVCRPSRF